MVIEKPIALIGMSGAGKTTIGKLLSDKLGVEFVDTDEQIEDCYGKTISEIFFKNSEKEFRKIENKILLKVLSKPMKQVISTGGGTFINQKSQDILKKMTILIYLEEDDEVLWHRVSLNDNRPLVKSREEFLKMVRNRECVYNRAHIKVNCRNLSVIQVCNIIKKKLEHF